MKKKDDSLLRHSQVMMLLEDVRGELRVVAEVQIRHGKEFKEMKQEFPEIKEVVVGTQAMVAKNSEDIELMKSDLVFIKNELKKFIRQEEFETLEKRVILLERKVSRI